MGEDEKSPKELTKAIFIIEESLQRLKKMSCHQQDFVKRKWEIVFIITALTNELKETKPRRFR